MNRKGLVHPGSWWVIAIALIAVASSAGFTILLIQVLTLSALGLLVKEGTSMARSVRMYAALAFAVLTTRILFRLIFSFDSDHSRALFVLPELSFEFGGLGNIGLFGAVTSSTIIAGATEGLRLAAIVLSVGLANTLASPKKLLKLVPSALYSVAAALTIATNFAPALIESFERVRKSQSLRGRSKKQSTLTRLIIPVLEDALEQSIHLAATMSSRGYGRIENSRGLLASMGRVMMILAMCGFALTSYLLLATNSTGLAFASLVSSIATGAMAIKLASANQKRTRFEPEKFKLTDALIGIFCLVLILSSSAGWLS